MQLPTIHCATHTYALVVTLNESLSYKQQFLQTESTMVASVKPDNLHDNAALSFKVQVRNSLSEIFKETHITNFCKFSFCSCILVNWLL